MLRIFVILFTAPIILANPIQTDSGHGAASSNLINTIRSLTENTMDTTSSSPNLDVPSVKTQDSLILLPEFPERERGASAFHSVNDPDNPDNPDNLVPIRNATGEGSTLFATGCGSDDFMKDSIEGNDQKRSILVGRGQACSSNGASSLSPAIDTPKNRQSGQLPVLSGQQNSREQPKSSVVTRKNPCTLPKSFWVTCGGAMVGDSGLNPDFVLNCVPGEFSFPIFHSFFSHQRTLIL